MFDLQGVALEVDEAGQATLKVTMGALGASVPGGNREEESAGEGEDGAAAEGAAEADAEGNGEAAPAGDVVDEAMRLEEAGQFDVSGMLAVIDVYLDTGEGGADETLSGPNMLLPT